MAVTDNVLMIAAVLLSSCRYILRDQPGSPVFSQMALEYRQECLRALRREIAETSPLTALTVAKAIALAIDEVSLLRRQQVLIRPL